MMPTASRHSGCWNPLFPKRKILEADRKILSPNAMQATRDGQTMSLPVIWQAPFKEALIYILDLKY
jgi:hypothetical protein